MNTDNEFKAPSSFEENIDLDKNLNIEMDKTRIFWIFVLSTLVITFVFVFGYWIGERNSSTNYLKLLPNQSVDINNSMANNNVPAQNMAPGTQNLNDNNNIAMNTQQNPNVNDSQQPNTAPNNPSSNIVVSKDNNVSNEELNILDQGNQESINQTSKKEQSVNTDEKTVSAKPISKAQKTQTKKQVAPTKKTVAASTTTKKATPAAQAKKQATGKYIIQLASLNSQQAAERLTNEMHKKGFKQVFVLKKGVLYRVRYGTFSTYAEAKKNEPAIKKAANIKDTLIVKL